jgi:hypothetical protein
LVEKAEISSWHFIGGESRNTFLAFYFLCKQRCHPYFLWARQQNYPFDILLVIGTEVASWHYNWWRK